MSFPKGVTFREPVLLGLNESIRLPKVVEDSLTFTRIETPVDNKKSDSGSETIKKRKTKSIKVTQLQKLKTEQRRLSKELIVTRKSINEDSKRRENESYTPYENRHRLARATSELQSKMANIQSQIDNKETRKKKRSKKAVKTRVKKNLITAEKQHKRILLLSEKMLEIQLDEANLRTEIASEISSMCSVSPVSGRSSSARPNTTEDWNRVPSSSRSLSDAQHEEVNAEDEIRLISGLGAYAPSLEDKIAKADKMAHKYDLTRELRNTIHEHMISRSYSYSYFNIIPPYKKKKEKPRKTKLFFNRKVYEDKITVLDFSKKLHSKPVAKAC